MANRIVRRMFYLAALLLIGGNASAVESLAGSQWVQASTFEPLSAEELFSAIFKRIEQVKAQGRQPVVMVDLDETLYDFRPRNRAVYLTWAEENAKNVHFARVLSSSPLLLSQRSPFDMAKILDSSGVSYDQEEIEALISYWQTYSQSNNWVHLDQPFPHSVEMLNALYSAGTKIIYMTSRFENMREGTEGNLVRDGFPLKEQGCPLIMRVSPRSQQVAWQLKVNALQRVMLEDPQVELVATIDNEPGTAVALRAQFSRAYHVFMHSWFGERSAEVVHEGLFYILGFPKVDECL